MRWIRRIAGCLSLCPFAGLSVLGAQSGLLGHYFDEATPPPQGTTPAFARVDPTVSFMWSGDAPTGTPIQPDDLYSARWTGHVRIATAGTWTFGTISNDGVRLWIDGELVIDEWTNHINQADFAPITFDEPGWFSVRLEHYNGGGNATMQLVYTGPGQNWTVIPSEALCAEGNCLPGLTLEAGADFLVLPSDVPFVLVGRFAGLHHSPYPPSNDYDSGWSQIGGAPAIIETPNSMLTHVTPIGSGLMRFELKVSDQNGFDTDDVLAYVVGEQQVGVLQGTLAKWQTLTLTFQHDTIMFEGGTPNPFIDRRLQVTFLHPASGTLHTVPGYFAADGNAAETGASSGDRWRVHFTPDQAGRWYYFASFRGGPNIALDFAEFPGEPLSFDGGSGSFDVEPSIAGASGFLSKGRLEYVGESYLRFAESGEWFLSSGANSPENFLGYFEFDNTTDQGGVSNGLVTEGKGDGLHHFDAHLEDYVHRGVSTWRGGMGERIYGAIDYLASKEVNSLYALTYNIDGGDGREVWPWFTTIHNQHFDVSKLDQWGRVFEHMTRAGVALHVQTQETENEFALDGGTLGIERKLYYRELVARFGHALALTWDLGEENDNTPEQRRQFADFIRALDPWEHPITVHPHIGGLFQAFGGLFGTHLEMATIQGFAETAAGETLQLVTDSTNAGRPWAVLHVELAPADLGAVPDAVDFNHDALRKQVLWGNLMSRGSGVEWYFGYGFAHDDLDCEDFRSRANLWDLTANALEFFRTYLPFAEMESADGLATGFENRVLAQRGLTYAVYLPNGGAVSLNLEGFAHAFDVEWFNPRLGGAPIPGAVTQVVGPGTRSLGSPPAGGGDWVALVRRQANLPPVIEELRVEPTPFTNGRLGIRMRASDPNGLLDLASATMAATDPNGKLAITFALRDRGLGFFTLDTNIKALQPGTWQLAVTLRDAANASATSSVSFVAK